jgi:hypothetical protein
VEGRVEGDGDQRRWPHAVGWVDDESSSQTW